MQVVQQSWSGSSNQTEPAKRLTAKFKALRENLKNWQSGFYTISGRIKEIKLVLYFLETLELLRDLSVSEWNFKNLVCNKLISLLKQKREYWKQRGKIIWVKEGDARTRFFHTHATIRNRRNSIPFLTNTDGVGFTDHEAKASLI
jgi:hypothetical protein